ncbi:MAG: hypothetical protein M0P92_05680 [Acholeplasmataceae bacterium]|nr:hypothetical protein [Acholeplasmataceae bacterium]
MKLIQLYQDCFAYMCWVTYFDTANSLFQKEAPRILDVGRSVGIANLTI